VESGGTVETDLREYVIACAQFAERDDHYGVLGIDPSADPSSVAKAYQEAIERMACARFSGKDYLELRGSLKTLKEGLDRARLVLADEGSRVNYDQLEAAKLYPNVTPWSPAASVNPPANGSKAVLGHADRVGRAFTLSETATRAMAEGKFDEAVPLMREAVELDSGDAGYRVLLGRAILGSSDDLSDDLSKEARRHLESACMRAPYDAPTRFAMGQYWRRIDVRRRYRSELEATIRCDPGHSKAIDELAALDVAEREHAKGTTDRGRWGWLVSKLTKMKATAK